MNLLWRAWRAYAHRAGQYHSWALLTVVYVVVLGPMALATRLAQVRLLDPSGGWVARPDADRSLTDLRRQF